MSDPKDVQAPGREPLPDPLALISDLLAGNAVLHPEAERILREFLSRPIPASDELLRAPNLEVPDGLLDVEVQL